MTNYDKLDRLRLTAEHIRLISNAIQAAWGKLYVASQILNNSADFQRVAFDATTNKHFRVTRRWLADAVARYDDLRYAVFDAEESALDMIEYNAIQAAIGGKDSKGNVKAPNFNAVNFVLSSKGKKRGYGYNTEQLNDIDKQLREQARALLEKATPETVALLSGIPEPKKTFIAKLKEAEKVEVTVVETTSQPPDEQHEPKADKPNGSE